MTLVIGPTKYAAPFFPRDAVVFRVSYNTIMVRTMYYVYVVLKLCTYYFAFLCTRTCQRRYNSYTDCDLYIMSKHSRKVPVDAHFSLRLQFTIKYSHHIILYDGVVRVDRDWFYTIYYCRFYKVYNNVCCTKYHTETSDVQKKYRCLFN